MDSKLAPNKSFVVNSRYTIYMIVDNFFTNVLLCLSENCYTLKLAFLCYSNQGYKKVVAKNFLKARMKEVKWAAKTCVRKNIKCNVLIPEL